MVSESLRIMYAPVPKAACTTLKRLIAEAAGTYDESALLRLTAPNHTPEQAIHHPMVHGLTYFRHLHDDEQEEILSSPDWWRVTGVRNPYARAYSAFENNVLLMGGTVRDGIKDRYQEIMEGGLINLSATFDEFIRSMAEHRLDYFKDDHLRPQIWQNSPDAVDYTHFMKVETMGSVASFAQMLSERAGRQVVPRRLNEGLGLSYRDVMTAGTARLIEFIYEPDFVGLGYAHEEFPETREPRVLTTQETKLVRLAQRMWLRQWQMSVAALEMRGFRYGAGQMWGRTLEKLGISR